MNTPSHDVLIPAQRLFASAVPLALAAGLFLSVPPASVNAQAVATPSPSASASPAASPAATTTTTTTAATGDLLAAAKTAGTFNTFLKALEAGGLTATLQKPGPYTVFAPTDTAFAKLPAGTLDNLLKPENKTQLVALLSYHIAEGKYTKEALAKIDEVKTLEGTEVDIETSSDGKSIDVDEGKIVAGGSEASNGIIHALDTVLQP